MSSSSLSVITEIVDDADDAADFIFVARKSFPDFLVGIFGTDGKNVSGFGRGTDFPITLKNGVKWFCHNGYNDFFLNQIIMWQQQGRARS